MRDVLDLIDTVLDDVSLSRDAMRWVSGMHAFHETVDPDEPRHPLVERPGAPGTPCRTAGSTAGRRG